MGEAGTPAEHFTRRRRRNGELGLDGAFELQVPFKSGVCSFEASTTLDDTGYLPFDGYDALNVDEVRQALVHNNETAVVHLCYAALEHAADGITNADEKLLSALTSKSWEDVRIFVQRSQHLARDAKNWARDNRCRAACMVLGLGGTAYEAKTLLRTMRGRAQSFIDWSRSTTNTRRFLGFVVLMTSRLGVSTLVPPTSPGFGFILQAATPDSLKWTAMPLFLLASTIAGAAPYVMDKLLQVVFGQDFMFTMCAKSFADAWPLTCWTGPTMRQVFEAAGGGKVGASLAVIFAHAVPFMGAQTTLLQRYYLPHPVDTIISQPFGMSEDLIGMALAEAVSNPTLASVSLSALICAFNSAHFALFSECRDSKALLTAILNAVVGLFFALSAFAEHTGLEVVACSWQFSCSRSPS